MRLLLAGACLLGLARSATASSTCCCSAARLALGWFPLLAVGTNLAYLLLAAPLGHARRPDRPGCGCSSAATPPWSLVYLLLFGAVSAAGRCWSLSLALYGGFYAATDGVLMALAGPVLPAELRTTGIALIQTGQALAYLVSSVLFGLAWQRWGAGRRDPGRGGHRVRSRSPVDRAAAGPRRE